jgi:peptidoglycan/LPS O-acetylase OafA/YrhL
MTKNVVYLSGLNGLRAIAAISVVLGHVTSYSYSTFNLPTLSGSFDGVTLFFVISGFLITYLLLIEKEEKEDIAIKQFYIRRILRIWPIYYLIILIILVIALFNSNISDIYSYKIFYYLFFAANVPLILQNGIIIIVHYWSIGVEEQFYLFWPWFVNKIKNKIIPKTVLIIILFFIIKSLAWYLFGNHSLFYKSFAVSRFHCMLIGAVGAMMYKNKNKFFITFFTNIWSQIISWLLIVLLFFNCISIPAPLLSEFTAIISLVLIMSQISKSSTKIINLENGFFDFLGKISYGIYIIHPLVILLFCFLYKDMNLSIIPKTIIVYSSVYLTTILCAYLSYEFFEKRFLKMKTRFTIVKSSNSKYNKE